MIGFEKWFEKCFYEIGYKIVVFGLRNGLRNVFMKLDTEFYDWV